MAEFTFLELHFEDSDLTANAPYSRDEKEIEAGALPAEDSASKRGTLLAAIVGSCFLIAVAYFVRTRILGGDGGKSERKR
jgi:hypothetical protein